MPCPLPMSRQFPLSFFVACISLGYQASGTAIVRPSESSTVNVSPVTVTSPASGNLTSTVEIFIPRLHENRLPRFYYPRNPAYFGRPESATHLKPYRFQPELGDPIISFDVNMRRFVTIARVEEKAIRTFPQYGRHNSTMVATNMSQPTGCSGSWPGPAPQS